MNKVQHHNASAKKIRKIIGAEQINKTLDKVKGD